MKFNFRIQKTELRAVKSLKSLLLILSSFFILNSSLSQTYPVQVTPVISGPNLPYLSYYGDQNQHLNVFVLLTDFTAPSQNVRLKLSFTGPNLRFETNPFASSLPIYTLNPGEPLLITGTDLLPYLLEQNLLQTEGNAVDLNKLPEGFYTLCVDVIKNDVNAEILSTNNCRSFYIQEIQPPLLNLPLKFSQVDTTEQIISFLWTQPLNYTPNPSVEIRYHFKLYEWIDTTNFNIFATGQGLVYEEETNLNIQIINTAFDVYLRSGYKYIWQVQAKAYDANTGAFLDLITQNGVSAPFWFNYGEKQSLQATLTNGLTLDLSAQAQNTRKGMAFWTITDETPGEGLSDYEAYIIEYRKFDSTGVNPYDWHSDTLQNKNFDIYQLEPAQAYEVRVSALVGDYRTPILDTARFVTPPQVDYACNSETQPFSQTTFTPLQSAYAGMVFQLGQFELTVSEITSLQQVGHYTGKGTIKHDFLGGAKCNVTFEDLLVDQEFVVREGEAQAVTDGAENWTNQHYLDMVTPYPAGGVIEAYGFLNDSTAFVVVGVDTLTYSFPENGNLPIVVQGANNVEIQFWPDGTIVVTTYGTTPSADHLDATADRFAEFEAVSGQEKFFDKKQYDHFASNYELISCENNFNYFVSNTAKGTVGTTQVKAVYHVRTPGYSASGVSFKLGGGYSTVAHTQENDTTFVLTLPERSFSYDVYAFYGELKIGKLRVVSLEQKERKVRIVPLVAISHSESAIEQTVNSIYAPANVTLDVKIDSVFSTAEFNAQTVFSDPEVVGMQKYTAQMRALRDAYKETHELASNEYLLFVIPGFETAAIDGYMVRGKGLGFVKLNGNLVEFVHTLAHELGHGMGGLTHSWGEDVLKKGLTNNLMDYSAVTASKLTKQQWEDLNKSPNVISIWDDNESAKLGNAFAFTPNLEPILVSSQSLHVDKIKIKEYSNEGTLVGFVIYHLEVNGDTTETFFDWDKNEQKYRNFNAENDEFYTVPYETPTSSSPFKIIMGNNEGDCNRSFYQTTYSKVQHITSFSQLYGFIDSIPIDDIVKISCVGEADDENCTYLQNLDYENINTLDWRIHQSSNNCLKRISDSEKLRILRILIANIGKPDVPIHTPFNSIGVSIIRLIEAGKNDANFRRNLKSLIEENNYQFLRKINANCTFSEVTHPLFELVGRLFFVAEKPSVSAQMKPFDVFDEEISYNSVLDIYLVGEIGDEFISDTNQLNAKYEITSKNKILFTSTGKIYLKESYKETFGTGEYAYKYISQSGIISSQNPSQNSNSPYSSSSFVQIFQSAADSFRVEVKHTETINFLRSVDPFEPIAFVFTEQINEIGIEKGKVYLMPAIWGYCMEKSIQENDEKRWWRHFGNTAAIVGGVIAAPFTGGASFALAVGGVGVATADELLLVVKDNQTLSEYHNSENFYMAWEIFYNTVMIADGLVGGYQGITSLPQLYQKIRTLKYLKNAGKLLKPEFYRLLLNSLVNGSPNTLVRGVSKNDFVNTVGNFANGANAQIADQAWSLWMQQKWGELETLFKNNNINYDASIDNVWPPMSGFSSITESQNGYQLNNKVFDRFQKQNSLGGGYASPVPNNSVYSLPSRALGVNYDDLIELGQDYYYFKFKIINAPSELKFTYGEAAPWFGEMGGAIQIKSSQGFHNLTSNIVIIEKWHFSNGVWTQIQ